MQSPYASAQEHLAEALESIRKAEESLKIGRSFAGKWLVMEALGRIRKAGQDTEIAGAHVSELLERENGSNDEAA